MQSADRFASHPCIRVSVVKRHRRPVAILDSAQVRCKARPRINPTGANNVSQHSARACSLALHSLASIAQAADATKPNIILILADDLGYETLGANGGESYKTPNLDRLAATGMRFERCHVQPLCTPTRVQLMTGMSNVRNYIEFGSMDPKATTFGNLLKNAGYATGIAGKWQLGRDKDLPQRFGFDEVVPLAAHAPPAALRQPRPRIQRRGARLQQRRIRPRPRQRLRARLHRRRTNRSRSSSTTR